MRKKGLCFFCLLTVFFSFSSFAKDKVLQQRISSYEREIDEREKSHQKQIEEYELAQANASKSLENKYNEKILNLLYEKENMVSSLNDSITTLQHQNDLLHNELKTQNEENRQRAIEYERQIKQ